MRPSVFKYSNVDTSWDFEDAAPDEEEMMYGIATANSVYEDTNLNQSSIHPTPHYCAVIVNSVEMTYSIPRNSLYEQQHENINSPAKESGGD
ncbi:PREDICTED: uncharacterized protein LOC109475993 [Branchiostoma belcheri]|uniref:Uncharacterized protein LOC109475993 n=1 Tax=Branchiostoma belcheri TaxID=7741 RepID=A0A6P4ZRW0_BRABE|nr:PREDICTED: uncharacterized protein LOC109475993 [Branchiostoma belcheri]